MCCPPDPALSSPRLPEEWASCPVLSRKRGPAFLIGVIGDAVVDSSTDRHVREQLELVFRWMRDPHPQEAYKQAGLGPPGDPEVRGLGLERTPIVILTSLAPGASQWVAKLVEDLAGETVHAAGLRVVAVFPFFADLYQQSEVFSGASDAEKATVAEWKGDQVIVRLDEDIGLDDVSLRARMVSQLHGDAGRRRLRAAGEYVAGYCDLLLALSKDPPSPQPDDSLLTAATCPAIVDAKRQGMTPGLLPVTSRLNWSDNGPVIHLHCPGPPPSEGNEPAAPVPTEQEGPAASATVITAAPAAPRVRLTFLQAYNARPEGVAIQDHQNWKWQTAGHALLRGVTDHLERLYHEPVPAGRWTRLFRKKSPAAKKNGSQKPVRTRSRKWAQAKRDGLAKEARLIRKELGNALKLPVPGLQPARRGPASGRPTKRTAQPTYWESLLPYLPATFRGQLKRLARWRRRISLWNAALDERIKNLNRWYFRFAFAAVLAIQLYENWSIVAPGAQEAQAGPDKETWQVRCAVSAAGLLVLGWLCHQWALKRHLETRQNDTRAFSEALRVQLYWTAAGTGKSVASTYLVRQRGEVSWIRSALCSLSFPYEHWAREFSELSLEPKAGQQLLEALNRRWDIDPSKLGDKPWAPQVQALELSPDLENWLLVGEALGWFKDTLPVADARGAADFVATNIVSELKYRLLEGVKVSWVEEQSAYFRKKADEFAARQDACERGGKVLILAGVALLLGILLSNADKCPLSDLPAALGTLALIVAALWVVSKILSALYILIGRVAMAKHLRQPKALARRGERGLVWIVGNHDFNRCWLDWWEELPPTDKAFKKMAALYERLRREWNFRKPEWLGTQKRSVSSILLPSPLRGMLGNLLLGLLLAMLTAAACLWSTHPEHIPPAFAALLPPLHAPSALPATPNLLAISRNLLLSLGTLCFAWSQLRFFSENIRRYDASAALFTSAKHRFDQLLRTLRHQPPNTPAYGTTLAEIHGLLHELGLEALAENAEWLMMHRARPHQPVQNTA